MSKRILWVVAMVSMGGCGLFGDPTVDACKKSCQHTYLDCGVGNPAETEAQCEANCSGGDGGVSCANPQSFYSCVNNAQCASLQGLTGASTLLGCASQAGCTLSVSTGGNGSGSTSGGSTTGGSSGTTGGHGSSGTTGGHGSSGTTGTSGGFTGWTTGGTTGGTTGPTIGQSCTPAQPDPCATSGLACDPQPGGTTYACELPTEFQGCESSVGCASSALNCLDLPIGQGGASLFLCVNPCSVTTDCPDLGTSCSVSGGHSVCLTDLCGPGSSPDGGSANGTTYYATCNNAGTGDGSCLPFSISTGYEGVCAAGGFVAAGAGGCAVQRGQGGGGLCAPGAACIQNIQGGAATLCVDVCAASAPTEADGGPGCPTGQSCLNVGALYGFCLEACTAGTTTCPSPTTCQTLGGGQSYCLP